MNFKDYDFSRCQYRVDEISDKKKVLDVYPEFKLHVEFQVKKTSLPGNINVDKIMRYILVLYQKNSPLLTIDNPSKRKFVAGTLANYDRTDKGFSKGYQEVINGKNELVNKMIIRFLRMQKNHDFASLMIYDNAFYNSLQELADAQNIGNLKDRDWETHGFLHS